MIRSIDASRVAELDSVTPAMPVSASGPDGHEAAELAGHHPAGSSAGPARLGGPRPIGELLQQVLANYQLVNTGPKPSSPLLLERENACHAPSLSLS
jgi:hypothetical protein